MVDYNGWPFLEEFEIWNYSTSFFKTFLLWRITNSMKVDRIDNELPCTHHTTSTVINPWPNSFHLHASPFPPHIILKQIPDVASFYINVSVCMRL